MWTMMMLTPKRHKYGVKHRAWVVEQVRQLCIATDLTEVPEIAANVT